VSACLQTFVELIVSTVLDRECLMQIGLYAPILQAMQSMDLSIDWIQSCSETGVRW